MNLLRELKKILSHFSLSQKKKKTRKRKKNVRSARGKAKKKAKTKTTRRAIKTAPKVKPRAIKKKAVRKKAPAVKAGRKPAAALKTKKPAPKKAVVRGKAAKTAKAAAPRPGLEEIGQITHYFPKVQAAVIKLQKTLAVGDSIQITNGIYLIKQKVTSLQINRIPIDEGRPGEEVGLLVKENVAPGDRVYKMKLK